MILNNNELYNISGGCITILKNQINKLLKIYNFVRKIFG